MPALNKRNHLSSTDPIRDWETYTDPDFDFRLEYPAGWEVETREKQPTPLIDDEAILKRIVFSSYPALVYLDVWLAKGKSFKEWLEWYKETRLVDEMLTEANATVAGLPAATFLQQHQRDLMITYFSDGQHVYRLMNWMTDNPTHLDAYWHMLDTFKLPGKSSLVAAEIPLLTKQNAMQSARQLFAMLVPSCCSYSSSGNPFPCCDDGNCTWWVYRQMSAVPFSGNAGTWWGQVPDHVAWTSSTGIPPTNKRSIGWQSGNPGHVAYINTYSSGSTVAITDMCCGEEDPPDNCWVCVRSVPNKPVSDYNGFIFRVHEPQ